MTPTPTAKIELSRLLEPKELEGVWPAPSHSGKSPLEVVLKFHRRIYPSEVLRDASLAFLELAEVTVIPHKTYHEVSFRFSDEGEDLHWRQEVLAAYTNHALVASMERKTFR